MAAPLGGTTIHAYSATGGAMAYPAAKPLAEMAETTSFLPIHRLTTDTEIEGKLSKSSHIEHVSGSPGTYVMTRKGPSAFDLSLVLSDCISIMRIPVSQDPSSGKWKNGGTTSYSSFEELLTHLIRDNADVRCLGDGVTGIPFLTPEQHAFALEYLKKSPPGTYFCYAHEPTETEWGYSTELMSSDLLTKFSIESGIAKSSAGESAVAAEGAAEAHKARAADFKRNLLIWVGPDEKLHAANFHYQPNVRGTGTWENIGPNRRPLMASESDYEDDSGATGGTSTPARKKAGTVVEDKARDSTFSVFVERKINSESGFAPVEVRPLPFFRFV